MMSPEFLTLSDDRTLAYHRTKACGEGAQRPGVVFLGGYSSDMTGTKAVWLEQWAQRAGRAFLRFDYTGHGASSGDFRDGCIGDWATDARAAIEALTSGPQILVGSSMGGWIALLLARAMPDRLAGLVGVAAAPDFTEDLMWGGMSEAQRAQLLVDGEIALPNPNYDAPDVITRRIVEDGRQRLVLRTPLALPCPLRLLHGDLDSDVPLSVGLRLLAHVDCADARLTVIKHGDHRLSTPTALCLLTEAVESIDA